MDGLFFIPGAVCLLLGIIFLLVFRTLRIKEEKSDRSLKGEAWARLTDTKEKLEEDLDDKVRRVYFGIYEYDAADGQHISSTSDATYYDRKDIPGAQGNMIKIRYNPNDPAEFAIPEEQTASKSIWMKFRKIGIELIVLGVLLLTAATAGILGLFDPLISRLFGST